ncbi:hypothetical protein VB834_30120 [Limnoraphis robusta Tam1]|nr:hypothetical protein [Limnoraphis robusta]MEA5496617.1 hypothetical protein [Limnoraphis robusta BA-68 BA1]MEA5543291.1 hypothetical protein [Limnoraphis robusta Tam1]
MEFSVINILALTASVLMIIVTGGIIYLTAMEWRDRRRQEREKRQ